jgi:uncharacterized protein (TIGR03067 family)
MLKVAMATFVAGAALLAVGQGDEEALKKEKARLEGKWKIARVQTGQGDDDKLKDGVVTFHKDGTLELNHGGETKKADYKLNVAAKPKEIDIAPEGDATKAMKAIYKIEKDTLKICLIEDPNGTRPTEFATKDGEKIVLVTLEKVK